MLTKFRLQTWLPFLLVIVLYLVVLVPDRSTALEKHSEKRPEPSKFVKFVSTSGKDADRGFGADFNWVPWTEALDVAKQLQKPVFLLFHKPWCGICKAFKLILSATEGTETDKQREEHKKLVELSEKFVMVNTEEEQGAGLEDNTRFGVPSRYVPRIYILEPDGRPLPIERKGTDYPNYFLSVIEIKDIMQRALKMFAEGVPTLLSDSSSSSGKQKPSDADEDFSQGPGGAIEWVPWCSAVQKAEELGRPIFLLIHETECASCRGLKSDMKNSPKRPELVELSRQFVMVHIEDESPADKWLAPDGHYVPRLLFLYAKKDEETKLLPVSNKVYPNNLAFFPSLELVIGAMREGLELYKQEVNSVNKLLPPPIAVTDSPSKYSTSSRSKPSSSIGGVTSDKNASKVVASDHVKTVVAGDHNDNVDDNIVLIEDAEGEEEGLKIDLSSDVERVFTTAAAAEGTLKEEL